MRTCSLYPHLFPSNPCLLFFLFQYHSPFDPTKLIWHKSVLVCHLGFSQERRTILVPTFRRILVPCRHDIIMISTHQKDTDEVYMLFELLCKSLSQQHLGRSSKAIAWGFMLKSQKMTNGSEQTCQGSFFSGMLNYSL